MRLENWFFASRFVDSPYTPPEFISKCLSGEVYGNQNFQDGDKVTTSVLVEFDPKGKVAVTKSGSVYDLGSPSSEWVSWVKEHHPKTLKVIDSFL